MARIARTIMLTATALAMTGCGGLSGPRLRPLPASPTQPVAQRSLGPLAPAPGQIASGQTVPGQPGVQQLDENGNLIAGAGADGAVTDAGSTAAGLADGTGQGGANKVASLGTPPADASANATIGRADLLGGWKIASGGEQCQLFMNLTSWKGGYRASTRGCNSPALKNISAWDLSGKQVTLKDGNGAAIGTVFPTDSGRYSGQTAGGQQLAFFR